MTDPKPSQLDKFKKLARELEADEDEARWDDRLMKVVKASFAGKAGMKLALGLLFVTVPTAAVAQAAPYKLIITWYQSDLTVIDYPSLARCEQAKLAIEAEIQKRKRENDALAPPGSIVIGKSPNGAFCMPG